MSQKLHVLAVFFAFALGVATVPSIARADEPGAKVANVCHLPSIEISHTPSNAPRYQVTIGIDRNDSHDAHTYQLQLGMNATAWESATYPNIHEDNYVKEIRDLTDFPGDVAQKVIVTDVAFSGVVATVVLRPHDDNSVSIGYDVTDVALVGAHKGFDEYTSPAGDTIQIPRQDCHHFTDSGSVKTKQTLVRTIRYEDGTSYRLTVRADPLG